MKIKKSHSLKAIANKMAIEETPKIESQATVEEEKGKAGTNTEEAKKENSSFLSEEGKRFTIEAQPREPKPSAWQQPDKVIFCKTGSKALDLGVLLSKEPNLSYSIDIAFTDFERLSNDVWEIEGTLFDEEGHSTSEGLLFFSYSSAAFRDIVFTLIEDIEDFGSLQNYRVVFSLKRGKLRAEVNYLTFATEKISKGDGEVERRAIPIDWQVFTSLELPKLILYTERLAETLDYKAKEEALEWMDYKTQYHYSPQASEDEEQAFSLLKAS